MLLIIAIAAVGAAAFFFAELAINWETPLVSRARTEAY